MRRVIVAVLVALLAVACGADDTTSSTDARSTTAMAATTVPPSSDAEPATTSTSASASDAVPVTTAPGPGAEPAAGVALREILDRYEAAARSSYPQLMRLPFVDCYRSRWRGSAPVDVTMPTARGDVLLCDGQPEPPDELGPLLVVVLDDAGTTASLWESGDSGERLALWSSGEQSLAVDAVPGQLCRDFLAHPVLEGWLTDPFYVALGSPRNAYTLIVAYWFLEGQPARMDVDGNGRPCETLFPPDVVADVWAGDF